MHQYLKGRSIGYLVAIAATVGMLLLRYALDGILNGYAPHLLFVISVMAAARYGGVWAGLLATVLGGIAGEYFFIDPRYTFRGDTAAHQLELLIFGAVGVLVSLVCEALHEARRKVERDRQALRESEERYRAIVETQAEMVSRFHPDGTILFVNGAYARARGTTPEALAGANFWDFIKQEDRPAVRAMLDGLRPESPEVRIENRFETSDGVRWTLWTNCGLAFDANGRATEVQSSGIDITDLKRTEAALQDADRRKDEFLATLAHELRNPLAPIRTGLELMKIVKDDPAVLGEVRDTMERQTLQLITLVDDLLDVSRITRGKLELRKSRVDLATVVQSAVEASRPFIDESRHELTVSIPDQNFVLEADPHRLAQILSNLLNNAAKYTPDGGRVWLSAERQGSDLLFEVRDNGIGIPEDMRERVFEMFAQLEDPLEKRAPGLGIGLTLVKSLAEMHGGSVEVQSDGPNRGSRFSVRLPISSAELMKESHAAPSDAPVPVAGNCRVLVVDDNEAAADMLSIIVKTLGCEVQTANDGRQAVDAAARFLPDVILMDLGMPKMNGYEAAQCIREQPWGRKMILAAVTGWGQDEDRQRTRAAGFDHHFVKPIEPSALRQLLAAAKSEPA